MTALVRAKHVLITDIPFQAIVICLFEDVNDWLRIDDGLEVFKLHGIGGMVGAFLTGIFATAEISSLDGIPTIVHGAWDGNGVQVVSGLVYASSY